MSSELRAKIRSIARPYVHFDLEADEIADGVMAVLTPPATAKLPEGVEVVPMSNGKFIVTRGGYQVSDYMDTERAALEVAKNTLPIALSAPPVPGNPPEMPDSSPAQPVPVCDHCDKPFTIGMARAFFEKLNSHSNATKTVGRFLMRAIEENTKSKPNAPPVPGDEPPLSPELVDKLEIDALRVRVTKDAARIAELEAALQTIGNLARHSQMNSGDKLTRIELAVLKAMRPTPAEKPDARKVAPNGRAMVRYYNHAKDMGDGIPWGIDDEGRVWCWDSGPREWVGSCFENESELKASPGMLPCTYDGTPITETKPDPLARAVTVGEMLRLAEKTQQQGWPILTQCIRAIFAPQGAEHVE